ncbi:hypothetical protein Agub_g6233 [Astrephomene gubernaculifera]|uniref:UDENN domain-containing protein n=1 Tax=Astrephomene gubernaculifera TaxID=47775 RepID=A0AAD3DPJ2_9CHLO|nr:hypothetical protein Agub_g6233 [Astrephomene gubernaculifera]
MYLLFFVSRLRVEGRTRTPIIYLRYKAATDGCEDVDFNEQLLNAFCFPLGPEAVQPKEVQASEEYTFTLTHGDGQRFTGFCRQIFPPAPRVGSKARYPQVLCIVAENPWCNFFFKVLQVAEQVLKGYDGLLDTGQKELPLDSQLGSFLVDLRKQLSTNPAPGEVLRVLVPNLNVLHGVSPPRYMGSGTVGDSLNWADGRIELQVPPDCGNGLVNSGIPLARLLFHVKVEGMLTLIASLLLERRIVFVARSRDTVTAAVQAAQALIYPFKWHHIYLPILPRDLVDYLSAPMPFLVGLTSEMLPFIRHIPMSEVTTVDLDLREVSPPPGASYDDGRALPYGRQLARALEAVFKTVRSPTEYESSPVITGVMQEYFVRLFGSYRRYIHDQAAEPLLRAANCVSAAAGPAPWKSGTGGGKEGWRGNRDVREGRGAVSHSTCGGSDSTLSPSVPLSSNRLHDDMLRGHGLFFDQPAFVAHRRSETVRAFLNAMRHSQLYQMFIQERLQMAASGAIELPPSNSQSFSFSTSSTASGPRTRAGMLKSNSAHNLATLDKLASQGGGGGGGGSVSVSQAQAAVTQQQQSQQQQSFLHGLASAGGREVCCSGSNVGQDLEAVMASSSSVLDPFELRVQRYPEHRRLLKEQLRSAIAEGAAHGGGGGSKLSNRLRRHRRTDSEDLHSQQQPFGSMHVADIMRRITTYSGLVDVSVASLDNPASYFAEWDMHEDDDDDSPSPSPSPRDREHGRSEHGRSESGNSLQSAESGEAAGPSGAVSQAPAAPGSRPGSVAGGGTGRDQPCHDNTPLRRTSVPIFQNAAKSAYMSLRGAPSGDSPGAAEGPPAPAAAAGPAAVSAGGAGGTRLGAFGSVFASATTDGGGNAASGASRCGVQVKTLPDGHRVYDGSFKDIMRLAATEAKNGLLNGLSGLTSPRGSPRGRDKEANADRRIPAPVPQLQQPQQQQRPAQGALLGAAAQRQAQQSFPGTQPSQGQAMSGNGPGVGQLGTVPLPGMPPAHAQVVKSEGGFRTAGGSVSSADGGGVGSRPAALSTPSAGGAPRADDPHQLQRNDRLSSFLSGLKDKVAGAGNKALGILPTPTYKPQTTGERAAKFKAQLTGGGGATLLAGADGKLKQPHAPQRPLSLQTQIPAGGLIPPPPTPLWKLHTPSASPAAPATPPDAIALSAAASPVAARPQVRAQSFDGSQTMATSVQGPGSAVNQPNAGGDATPAAAIVGATPATCWRGSATHLPVPTDWDPFGVGSAPPAIDTVYSAGGNNCATIGANGVAATTTTTSPFAVVPCGASATAAGGVGVATGPGSPGLGPATDIADLLGLSQPAVTAGTESSATALPTLPTGSSVAFDPFVACEPIASTCPLESAGSNDFAAFTSATSPRDFPGVMPLGSVSSFG